MFFYFVKYLANYVYLDLIRMLKTRFMYVRFDKNVKNKIFSWELIFKDASS